MKNFFAILKEWFIITFATLLIAVSVFFFLIPSHLSISSISGLGIILTNFIPLSLSMITLILNIFLLILAFFLLGKDFGIKTVYTSLLIPIFLGILEILFPDGASLTQDPLIDMICYCFFVSIGLSILFNRNASSGGIDIIAKLLNHFFRMELGHAMSLAGMCVALSAILVYDIKTVLLSIIGTYLNGMILDHFIFGSNLKKRVCIISQKEEEIKQYILHELHSGATLYQAYGAYEKHPHQEIITIVDKNEYLKLMNYLAKTDPKAFITVYAVQEIIYQPKIW